MGKEASQVYTPRSGGSNKNLKNYSQEQLDFQKKTNEDLLHVFGYVEDGNPENNTPYFDFEGKASAESIKKMNYFKNMNEKAYKMRQQ